MRFMRIKASTIKELYALCDERSEYLEVGLENALVNEDIAKEAYKKAGEVKQKIEAKFDVLGKAGEWGTAYFAEKLLRAVYPKSMSKYIKCLEICGVEVEADED